MGKVINPADIAKVGTEHAHQVAVFAWAALNFEKYPELRMMFAIPNGGLRDKITAANLKAEGVRPHVPDIFLPVPRCNYHGLFVEMKKVKGQIDPGQLEFIEKLHSLGYGASICVGFDAAVETILSYLNYRG
jgi:hypothetical protein